MQLWIIDKVDFFPAAGQIQGMHHSWYGRGQGGSTLVQAAVSIYIPTWNTFWLQFDLRQNLSEALASYLIDISSSIQFIISSQRIANFALFPIIFQMLMRAFLFLHIDSNFLNSSLKIISDKPLFNNMSCLSWAKSWFTQLSVIYLKITTI